MTLDALEFAFLVMGFTASSLAIFLAWRAVHLRALAPACDELSTIEGRADAIHFDHHIYSAWWLDFSVGERPYRVEPGPWQGRVHRELRESPAVRVGFCPTGSRSRVWALESRGETVVSTEAQQIHARAQARAAFTGALLCLGWGLFCGLLSRRRVA